MRITNCQSFALITLEKKAEKNMAKCNNILHDMVSISVVPLPPLSLSLSLFHSSAGHLSSVQRAQRDAVCVVFSCTFSMPFSNLIFCCLFSWCLRRFAMLHPPACLPIWHWAAAPSSLQYFSPYLICIENAASICSQHHHNLWMRQLVFLNGKRFMEIIILQAAWRNLFDYRQIEHLIAIV